MMFHENEDNTNSLAIVHMVLNYKQESIFDNRALFRNNPLQYICMLEIPDIEFNWDQESI